MLLTASACRAGDSPTAVTADSASARPSAAPASSARLAKPLRPLGAESWRIDLPVEGFGEASVSVPLGATRPRPVVVALHGYDDRPDWQCGTWFGISSAHPFVLCPRGVSVPHTSPAEPRFTWRGPDETARELRAALTALKRRFGDYVAPTGLVLTGYSLGAERAQQIARQEPKFFSRLVLVEGGAAGYTPTTATIFAKGGGQRVLFVCAQSACRKAVQPDVIITERAGAEARSLFAGELGHMLDGRVANAIRGEWTWVVAGLEAWQSFKR
jgi:pimeloyl-ACP methyl ester carboxylesterase